MKSVDWTVVCVAGMIIAFNGLVVYLDNQTYINLALVMDTALPALFGLHLASSTTINEGGTDGEQ